MTVNRQWLLASRPEGEPTPANFTLREAPLPVPGDGQLLVRVMWLSLAPYMRWRMSDIESYAPPVPLGTTMVGTVVGEVVSSNHPSYVAGDVVVGEGGWQEYAVIHGDQVSKVDPAWGPSTTILNMLGMNGLTAWGGLMNIGKPQPGETVVVAAAAGSVGALVGQMARLRGCRVVGIAGGADKCDYVVNELGFDACIDHRRPDLGEALAQACPKGIDIYFENVGGAVWDAVLPLMNRLGRVPVCGLISQYNNAAGMAPGPDRLPEMMRLVLSKCLTIQGFLVTLYAAQKDQFRAEMLGWLARGEIRCREDVAEGIEQAPEAFIGMLKGRNLGKALVRIAAGPF